MGKTTSSKNRNAQKKVATGFEDIIDRITPTAVDFKNPNQITLGDTIEQIYTVYNYPSEVRLEWLSPFAKYSQCFISFQISEANKAELIENIDRTISNERVKILEAKSQTEIDEAEVMIERARELAMKVRADDGKAINLTTSIGVFGTTKDEVKKIHDRIEGDLEGLEFSVREMTHLQKHGFLQQLPICDNEYESLSGIDMPMDTWAAGLGIFTNQSLDHKDGIYLGTDRSGESTFWDIWDVSRNQQNSNLVILGTPGVGKSTTMKKLLLNRFAKGDSLIILDAEREYIGIGAKYGANIIEASGSETKATSGNEATIINPLQIRDFPEAWDDYDTEDKLKEFLRNRKGTSHQGPLSAHITFLKTWFPLYIPELQMKHVAVLEKVLYYTYMVVKHISEDSDPRFMEPNEFPTMSDLMNVVNDSIEKGKLGNEEFSADDVEILKDLKRYLFSCTEGADKFIFNGYTNINMESPFTIFDVHKLLDAPENVRNAQFCNITTFCWMRMTRDRSEKCILVVDEAHLFISKNNNQVFEWLSSSARRFRKYMGSLWLATQNVSDFLQDGVRDFGTSLLNNPDLKLIMRQRATDIEAVTSLFQLSSVEEDLMSKASRGEGLLFVGSQQHLFVNIEIEKNMLALISSTGGGR